MEEGAGKNNKILNTILKIKPFIHNNFQTYII